MHVMVENYVIIKFKHNYGLMKCSHIILPTNIYILFEKKYTMILSVIYICIEVNQHIYFKPVDNMLMHIKLHYPEMR